MSSILPFSEGLFAPAQPTTYPVRAGACPPGCSKLRCRYLRHVRAKPLFVERYNAGAKATIEVRSPGLCLDGEKLTSIKALSMRPSDRRDPVHPQSRFRVVIYSNGSVAQKVGIGK